MQRPLDHGRRLYDALGLEEAAQPPDLEERLAEDDANDKEVPPLDAGVCALSRVAVGALADDDVLLLVPDLGDEIRQAADWQGQLLCTWLEDVRQATHPRTRWGRTASRTR